MYHCSTNNCFGLFKKKKKIKNKKHGKWFILFLYLFFPILKGVPEVFLTQLASFSSTTETNEEFGCKL